MLGAMVSYVRLQSEVLFRKEILQRRRHLEVPVKYTFMKMFAPRSDLDVQITRKYFFFSYRFANIPPP